MKRTIFAVLLVFGAAACDDDPDVVVVEDDEPDTDVDPDDCPDLTSTDGAPAPVTLADTFFEPDCFAVSSTQGLALANSGDVEHNFSVRGTDIDLDLDPGEELATEAVFGVLDFGTYEYYCEYHEDQGMVGVVTVQ